jgi:signal peptidase II
MKKWPWLVLSLIIVILDQATKYWAGTVLIPYDSSSVFSMVNFTLAFNTGAAFSFLSTAGEWARWFFAGFSFLISSLLLLWLIRTPANDKLQSTALAFILGGAVGNFYDRAVNGYVIDFIDVFYKKHHWPIFNLADTAICIGAFLLILDLILGKKAARERL